ncbi:DNA helicase RecQ [Gracilibacillus sp. YIM 98692]|uniref:DNA helicase RecQ n=1 Tax=Gracilibacillus sp. YIM 98692 TaxID=2663532 RepID=UPI0013D117A4|nr:DNA helicase RecQ [Gracilibacillus sp. YIM 98692]
MLEQAQKLLHTYYGYNSFRPGQSNVIEKLLYKQNTIAIMPTGGGKSICYQIPGLTQEGITLVISPLISLMKDQVDALTTLNIPATYINSSLTNDEQIARLRDVRLGKYTFLYVAPERLESKKFLHILQSISISLIAFDEAHCISQWGHDFRPSYRSVIDSIQQLNQKPTLIGLTATATKEVTKDLQQLLEVDSSNIVNTGFSRDNLTFQLVKGQDRNAYTLQFVQTNKEEAGIIYAITRKQVDQIHIQLKKIGVPVLKYHAGLTEEARQQAQNTFIQEEGCVMVATNAFGMGIDKSNVRYVVHYGLPRNLESYYQEAGRAGRDGEPSQCILLFSGQDISLQKYLIEQSDLDEEKKSKEYGKLQAMINYCHTNQCLPQFILHYFGDLSSKKNCKKCTNCNETLQKVDRTKEAQMVLSCIKRMNQSFGASLTAKVLKGSKDKKVKQFQFDQLSTYGLLHDYTEKELVNFIHFLVAENFLTAVEGRYPTLRLNQRSIDILKGELPVYVYIEKVPQKEATNDYPAEFFEHLRQIRKKMADQQGVPPYVLFTDRTLKELAKHKPQDEESLLQIHGMGEKKVEKYSDMLLKEISEWNQS